MKTFLKKTAIAALFLWAAFSQNAFAINIVSSAPGEWNNTATWMPAQVPGPNDDVSIRHAVTLGSDAEANSLDIAPTGFTGSLTGPFGLTVTGLLSVGNGTLNNTGNTTAGSLFINNNNAAIGATGSSGTVTISGAATIGLGYLIAKTLILDGETSKVSGTFNVGANGAGATFRIGSSGTMTLANTVSSSTDFSGVFTSPGTIENLGTIVKNTGIAIFFLHNTFNNSGSLELNGGSLKLFDNGGNFTGGSVSLESGTFLQLQGFNAVSNYNFTGGSVSGDGKLVVGKDAVATFSGSATLTTTLDFTFPTGGGTLTDNTAGLTPTAVTLASGTYQGTGAPTIPGELAINGGGTFNPGGDATIGSLDWLFGSIGNATATVSNITVNGAVNISGDGSFTKGFYKKKLICNSGATTTAVAVDFYNNCQLSIPGGQILHCDAGIGTVKLGALVTGGGTVSGKLELAGTLNKTGANLLYLKNLDFVNTGSVYFGEGETQFTGEFDIQYSGNGSIELATGAKLRRFQGPNTSLNYTNATFINNGTLLNLDLKFNGPGLQTLSGTGTLSGVILDNNNNLDITGDQDITASFRFISGKAFIQNSDLTFLTSGVNVVTPSSTSYFVTPSTGRAVMPISFSTVFPVGPNTSSYNPITVAPSGASTFAVRVHDVFDADKPTTTNDVVKRQWQIDREEGSASAALTFQWNAPAHHHELGSFNTGLCHVSRWDGTGWSAFVNSAANCPGGICTRTQTGVSDFSPFGIASGLALPIELTGFRGHENGPANHFEWETAAESNTKNQQLQRSADGQNSWRPIADRAAAGSSQAPVFYGADDNAPLAEAFYRVVFEDLDGRTDASPIVFIKRQDAPGGQFSVFPNPIGVDGFWLATPAGAIGKPLTARLFDAAGRLVFYESTESAAAEQYFFTEDKLPAGAYFLKIGSETAAQTLPILVR